MLPDAVRSSVGSTRVELSSLAPSGDIVFVADLALTGIDTRQFSENALQDVIRCVSALLAPLDVRNPEVTFNVSVDAVIVHVGFASGDLEASSIFCALEENVNNGTLSRDLVAADAAYFTGLDIASLAGRDCSNCTCGSVNSNLLPAEHSSGAALASIVVPVVAVVLLVLLVAVIVMVLRHRRRRMFEVHSSQLVSFLLSDLLLLFHGGFLFFVDDMTRNDCI